MAVTRDIVATYRNPGQVFTRLSSMGVREDRALFWLIAGCGLSFVSQWPRVAREAAATGADLTEAMTGALMAWVFFAPLLFYILAFVLHMIMKVLGRKAVGFAARLALFWSFFAAVPLLLFYGLAQGLAPGQGASLVGALWVVAFLVFLLSGLRVAYWTGPLAGLRTET